jgi:hypothetical protein
MGFQVSGQSHKYTDDIRLKLTFDPEVCNYFLTSYRLSSGKAGQAEPVMVKYIAW